MRQRREGAGGELGAELLAGGDQPAQCGQYRGAALRLPDEPADDGGNELDHGDTRALQDRPHAAREGEVLLPDDDDGSADEQRGEHLPDRDVEDQRRGEREPVAGGELQVGDLRPQVVDHAPVLDGRALRAAGGAGGEDAVAGLAGLVAAVGAVRVGVGAVRSVCVRAGRADDGDAESCGRLDGGLAAGAAVRGAVRGRGVVEQVACRGAFEDLGDPLRRPVGGEGEVDGAEPFEGEERGDRVRRALADGRDDAAGAAAGRDEGGTDAGGAGEQPRVGQGGVAVDDGGRVRGRGGEPRDVVEDAGAGVELRGPAQGERRGAGRRAVRERQRGERGGGGEHGAGRGRGGGRGHEAPALWWRSSSWKKPPIGTASPAATALRWTCAPTARSRMPSPNGEKTTVRSAGTVTSPVSTS